MEAEDAVAALLERIFERPASSYTDAISLRTTVTAYLDHQPTLQSQLDHLRTGLKQIREMIPAAMGCKAHVSTLLRKDWANSWRKHFHPIEVGRELLVRPSWSKRRPRKGQALVRIDPGLAFGTGQHPTTSFCLRELVARRDRQKKQSFLDLGTGSGILAIAAAKLGYAPIEAIDLDAAAIKVSRSNARWNRVEQTVRFKQQDFLKIPLTGGSKFDVVCANLLADLILTQRERILGRLNPAGILVLSGILGREFAEIQHHYESAGLCLLSSKREKEWRSGSFAFKSRLRKGVF
jgi:ribosomal protein L11 methyltransferase